MKRLRTELVENLIACEAVKCCRIRSLRRPTADQTSDSRFAPSATRNRRAGALPLIHNSNVVEKYSVSVAVKDRNQILLYRLAGSRPDRRRTRRHSAVATTDTDHLGTKAPGRGAGVGRALGVGTGLGVGVGLGVPVAVDVAVGVGVVVGVAVGVTVGVIVGVDVGVGVGVGTPDGETRT
jgi:hypothetical protein